MITKFICDSIEEYVNIKTAYLTAVYSNTEENKILTRTSPTGKIEIVIAKDSPAYSFFIPGKEYYVAFSQAN